MGGRQLQQQLQQQKLQQLRQQQQPLQQPLQQLPLQPPQQPRQPPVVFLVTAAEVNPSSPGVRYRRKRARPARTQGVATDSRLDG